MKASINSIKWAKVWVMITCLLVTSAAWGVQFVFLHKLLAGMCTAYGVLVWRALHAAQKRAEAKYEP